MQHLIIGVAPLIHQLVGNIAINTNACGIRLALSLYRRKYRIVTTTTATLSLSLLGGDLNGSVRSPYDVGRESSWRAMHAVSFDHGIRILCS